MSRPRVALALVAVALVLVAALAWAGALTRERSPVGATGAPHPVDEVTEIEVGAGEVLCATNLALGPPTAVAELHQRQDGRRPPVSVRAEGPGYASPEVELPQGERGRKPFTVPIEPPDRDLIGKLCLRNEGDDELILAGTTELRTYTRLQTTVEGDPVDADVALTFYGDEPVTAVSAVPLILDRMSALRGFLGATWLNWILFVLVVVGVPVLVFRALDGALRER